MDDNETIQVPPIDITGRAVLASLAAQHSLPRGFSGLSPSARLREILELDEPAALVRSLRADELYFLMRGIGDEESRDLLVYASPEQRRAVVDLDCWADGRYDPERFDRILDMLSRTSLDLATSLLKNTDPEALALHVLARARVVVAADDDDQCGEAAFLSPDNVFLIDPEDGDDVPGLRRFLDLLYNADLQRAQLALQGGLRDTNASLEEASFGFRNARLQDLGFPPDDERFSIWEPFDVAAVRERLASGNPAGPHRFEGRPLGMVLRRGTGENLFLWQAVGLAGSRSDLAGFLRAFLNLVNRVLAARTTDLSEAQAWESAALSAAEIASIGFERLSDGDLATAAAYVPRTWPVEAYRTGIEFLRPLHLLARRVATAAGGTARLDLFEPEMAETLRAALLFPPVRAAAAGIRGEAVDRDFRTVAEVEAAITTVRDATAILAFAREVLGYDPRAEARIRCGFAGVFLTAACRAILSGTPSLEPFDGESIRDLLVAAFDHGRVRPSLREATVRLVAGRPQAVAAFLDRAIDRLEQALGGLDPADTIDVRFVGDVLVVKG